MENSLYIPREDQMSSEANEEPRKGILLDAPNWAQLLVLNSAYLASPVPMWGQFSAMWECSIIIVFTVGKGMLTQKERTRTQKIDITSKLSFSMVELQVGNG